MARKIFVNLAVKRLDKSIEFFKVVSRGWWKLAEVA
jgi:predicted lactoylglutathione lyase